TPWPGVANMSAKGAPASVLSRNITPALAHVLVLGIMLLTLAIIRPSPVQVSDARWNWSLVLQMSAPLPATVQVPLPAMKLAEPLMPGLPMSVLTQSVGTSS